MSREHLPMWRNAKEIETFGIYLMYSINDEIDEKVLDIMSLKVEIAQVSENKFFLLLPRGNEAQDVVTLDEEIRFFGPLTDDYLDIARELLIGLTGGMK